MSQLPASEKELPYPLEGNHGKPTNMSAQTCCIEHGHVGRLVFYVNVKPIGRTLALSHMSWRCPVSPGPSEPLSSLYSPSFSNLFISLFLFVCFCFCLSVIQRACYKVGLSYQLLCLSGLFFFKIRGSGVLGRNSDEL